VAADNTEPVWTVIGGGIPTDAAVQTLARLLLLESVLDDPTKMATVASGGPVQLSLSPEQDDAQS